MNKKILVLGLVGIFMLTGFTTVSAIKIENQQVETLNDLPDLKISLKSPEPGLITVILENIADVPAVIPTHDDYMIFELTIYKVYNFGGEEFEWNSWFVGNRANWPEDQFGEELPPHYYREFTYDMLKGKPWFQGDNFILRAKVWADNPIVQSLPGWIDEVDDWYNNYAELDFETEPRSRNLAIDNPLSKTKVSVPTNDKESIFENLEFRHDDGEMDESVHLRMGLDRACKQFTIPIEVIRNVLTAKLWVYAKSDGIMGDPFNNLDIDINEPDTPFFIRIIPLEDFPANKFAWKSFKIPFPKSSLGHCVLPEIPPWAESQKFYIDGDGEKNEDNLFIGIDTDNDFDKSSWTANGIGGGVEECNGELMMYLTLTYVNSKSRSVNHPFLVKLFKTFPIIERLLPIFTEIINIY